MTDLICYTHLIKAHEQQGAHALLFTEYGETEICGGGKRYTLVGGSLLLIPPEAPLTLFPAPTGRVHLLELRSPLAAHPFFAPLFAQFGEAERTLPLSTRQAAHFAAVMAEAAKLPADTPNAPQRLFAKLLELLAMLTPDIQDTAGEKGHARGRVAAAVLDFVDAHIGEAISLDDIASALFISKYHMSHVFKRETGLSVGEAVLRRKVERADALLASGIPAHRVCELVGFNHYSAFFRIYKRIKGHSPKG